jgi:hypothetical protein
VNTENGGATEPTSSGAFHILTGKAASIREA